MNFSSITKLAIIFSFMPLFVCSSFSQGISFLPNGTTLKYAMTEALKQDKFLLVELSASWVAPTKKMAKKVYSRKDVGDFINSQYVCCKIDIDKNDGPSIVKEYDIKFAPTFIIFHSSGTEIGRFVGASKSEEFIKKVVEYSQEGNNGLEEINNIDERLNKRNEILANIFKSVGVAMNEYYLQKQAQKVIKSGVNSNLSASAGSSESGSVNSYESESTGESSTTQKKGDCPSLKVAAGKWYCANTGECGMCNGDGLVSNEFGVGGADSQKCTLCNGTGKCKYCQ